MVITLPGDIVTSRYDLIQCLSHGNTYKMPNSIGRLTALPTNITIVDKRSSFSCFSFGIREKESILV
jgi:hypothetical protein